MMNEKRFVVETVEITDCDTDVSRIAKVITDTKETYSYEDLDEIVHKLNEQQATINKLQKQLDYEMQEHSEKTFEMLEFMKEKKVFDEWYKLKKKEVIDDE